MIELLGVSKAYGGGQKKAVDRLSLTVKPGEVFGFLGPNGAGKTTTIKLIVGLLRPDSGSLRVNGCSVTERPLEVKRQLGYVPDSPTVYDRLTGLEYLRFIADVYGVPASDRRKQTCRYAELFDLVHALPERISGYSHGMRQKLVLMSTLMHDPPVWVLDEPMVGLDPRSAHITKELMTEHARLGKTLFFSTHVLEVAERLCDRVAIIQRGRVIAMGTMAELRQDQGNESLEEIFLGLTES